jgi:hypothetical protein
LLNRTKAEIKIKIEEIDVTEKGRKANLKEKLELQSLLLNYRK